MTTRTPPEIKWLLVERATLLGDIDKMELRRAMLAEEIERTRARVAAFDVSLRLLDARVRADAAGKIVRHCQDYGHRGALKAFIEGVLRDTESGLSMRAIGLLAAEHFSLSFVTKAELTRFVHNTVRPQLQRLRSQGLAEGLPGTPQDGLFWRWNRGRPSLAELAWLSGAGGTSASSASPGADDDHKDPTGHQVAYQRDGHAAG